MRVLVTGGTGYLGQAVVRLLHRAGHDVVLYGRRAAEAAAGFTGGAPAVTGVDADIRDAARLTAAARGCEILLHMAALVAVWRRRAADFDDVNVSGLRHVLEAARTCGVRRVVYTSSFLAPVPATLSGAPAWNDYQRTKAAADHLADAAVERGAPLVRLYPGVIYGPGPLTDGNLVGRQIADHLAGRLPGRGGADRIWSFAYIDDVAAAHVAAVERGAGGRRYLLGGDNATQMRPFEILRDVTGRPLPRRLPAWLVAAGAAAGELGAAALGRAPLVTTGTLEILLRDWPLNSELAQDELGYRVTPIPAGIGAIIDQLVQPGGTAPPDARSDMS